MLAALIGTVLPASALEPIKISEGDVALDLSGAVTIYRNQGSTFQVSTAPGADGIVRRIEVEANQTGAAGDWVMQYAPGDFGVVKAARFAKVYREA